MRGLYVLFREEYGALYRLPGRKKRKSGKILFVNQKRELFFLKK